MVARKVHNKLLHFSVNTFEKYASCVAFTTPTSKKMVPTIEQL